MFIDTKRVKWEKESEVDVDITERMEMMSKKISGVKYYPYVVIDNSKYFLEA